MDTTSRCKHWTDRDNGRKLRDAARQDGREVREHVLWVHTMGRVQVILAFADLLQDTLAVFDAVATPDLCRGGWIVVRHSRVGRVGRVF